MIKIIKTQFEKVGKGWFNMKETSKITYDFGKLKRFLTLVRLMMQDTLTSLIWRNYHQYQAYINSFVPEKVIIKDTNNIVNIYSNGTNQRGPAVLPLSAALTPAQQLLL